MTSGARDGLEREVSWSFGLCFQDEGQRGGLEAGGGELTAWGVLVPLRRSLRERCVLVE